MIIKLKLSGDAERFVKELKGQGLSEVSIIAKALNLLEKAHQHRLVEIDENGQMMGQPII